MEALECNSKSQFWNYSNKKSAPKVLRRLQTIDLAGGKIFANAAARANSGPLQGSASQLASPPARGILPPPARRGRTFEETLMSAVPVVEAHGARIPQIGLGTMTLKGEVCVEAVSAALKMGYRHLDTATFYENERDVGEGLRASGVKRDDVFITTKVRHHDLKADDFARAVDKSLAAMKLSSVDLLLIHWPNPQVPMTESIGALCQAKRAGKTRHIGVANFTVALLDEAAKLASEPLAVNQIEAHPFLDQSKVIFACKRLGLAVTAYCPIARGKVPGAAVLERIGKAHGKSAAQVSLRWLIQQDLIPIPRSATPSHLAANLDIFDFKLPDAEMAEIARLKRPDGRVVNPPQAPKWDS